jgi:hypothetical protein
VDSKCRPIPFFSSKSAFDAVFSSSRTKDTFRFWAQNRNKTGHLSHKVSIIFA